MLSITFWAATIAACAIFALCMISETQELAFFYMNERRRACMLPTTSAGSASQAPMVSLHLPICREPVDVVEQTLMSLAAIAYNNYEVIVVCNNTSDAALWQPIEKICIRLGARFKFVFVEKLAGFKAGALNLALRRTAAEAELVGVIDCDYVVTPRYLTELVGYFAKSTVAFIQTPQDYRSQLDRFFTAGCYWEYWQFFEVGMVLRDSFNAPMLHGTMCLVRRDALEEVGGWSEWCLTEDSETGLKLLARGHQAKYIKKSYGHGLLPLCYGDYKAQRWRWSYGTAQQFVSYVFGVNRGRWRALNGIQRRLILQSWTPWARDATAILSLPLMLVLCVCRLAVGVGLRQAELLAVCLLATLVSLSIRQYLICIKTLRLSCLDACATFTSILSLTPTIGLGFLAALCKAKGTFNITPKRRTRSPNFLTAIGLELLLGMLPLTSSGLLIIAEQGRLSLTALCPLISLYCVVPGIVMARADRRIR